ncbi:MAG: hypothetical protein ACFB10_05505 [Salibacteraceae bacterium]
MLPFGGWAQKTEVDLEDPFYLMKKRWISFYKMNHFLTGYVGGTILTEHFNTGVIYYEPQEIDGLIYFEPIKMYNLSLLTVTTEGRANIFEYNELLGVSLNVPLTGSFSVITTNNPDIVASTVVGTVSIPLLVQANFFRDATKVELDDFGFSVGLGVQYLRVGLLGTPDANDNLIENWNPDWVMPVGRLGFTFGHDLSTQLLFNLNPERLIYDGHNRQEKVTVNRFYVNLSLFLNLN